MADDFQKNSRDAAATEKHHEAVAAGQSERMLVRAVNGELVSYLPEEYGVARMPHGNTITSAGGNWVMAGLMIASAAGLPLLISLGMAESGSSPSGWLWAVPVIFLPLAFYFGAHARTEAHAVRLRRERGLPAPTSQTLDSKWHRSTPSAGN